MIKTHSKSKLYVTSNLYILENKCYYEEKKNDTLVNGKNWHHYWVDYGWEKINDSWVRRLNKHTEKKPKNNLYGVLDCGSNGDCLFHCIAEALNQEFNIPQWDANNIRKVASNCITRENYKNILEIYRLQKINEEFDGLWNPNKINNQNELKNIIEKPGNTFWGDHIIIQLLEEYMELNIVVLKVYTDDLFDNSFIKNETKIYPMGSSLDKEKKTIFLCYENEVHFTLMGYFKDNSMMTLFTWDNIPKELFSIYNEDCSSEYFR